MTHRDDLEGEMADPRLQLDANTEDRLLAGLIAPDDAPPAYAEVASALQTLGRQLPPPDAAAEATTIRTMTEILGKSIPAPLPQRTRRRRRSITRVALVLTTCLLGTTGVAFAGGLPDAAQSVASDLLAKVGINVPGPAPEADGHPDAHGDSSAQPSSRSSSLGVEGAISGASEGHKGAETDAHERRRGDHSPSGAPETDDGTRPGSGIEDSVPPAEAPHDGGTTNAAPGSGNAGPGMSTADDASLGRSDVGSAAADEADSERESPSVSGEIPPDLPAP